jgi:hypothetical protein
MRTLGPLYVGTLQYYHRNFLPIVEVGHTQETEIPFRFGKCLVFRVPFTKPGYYIGLFFRTVKDPHLLTDEDVDLIMMKAMRGRTAWTPNDGLYNDTF